MMKRPFRGANDRIRFARCDLGPDTLAVGGSQCAAQEIMHCAGLSEQRQVISEKRLATTAVMQ